MPGCNMHGCILRCCGCGNATDIPEWRVRMVLMYNIRHLAGGQVLLVGTRAGSEASLAEVLDIVSYTSAQTPSSFSSGRRGSSPAVKMLTLPMVPIRYAAPCHLVMHCWRARPIFWRYTRYTVCCVVQAALWHSIVPPAQALAEACVQQTTTLLQKACGSSLADHMVVIGAAAAAAGLHVAHGLPAGDAAEAHVAACCCMQVSCLPS